MKLKYHLIILISILSIIGACVPKEPKQTTPLTAEDFALKVSDISELGNYYSVRISKYLPYQGEGTIPEVNLVKDGYLIQIEVENKKIVVNMVSLLASTEDATKYFDAIKKYLNFLSGPADTDIKSIGDDSFSYSTNLSNSLYFRKGRVVSMVDTTSEEQTLKLAKIVENKIK